MNDLVKICAQCISMIDNIMCLFDGRSRWSDRELVRERMKELMEHFEDLIKEFRGTDIERVISEALHDVKVRKNSTPKGEWFDKLYAARGTLEYYRHVYSVS